MQKVYILGAVRTPLGGWQGNLAGFSEQKLAAMTMQDLIENVELDPASIDEIIIGNAKQTSTPSNLARHAQLMAGLPVEIPAYTVQRQSASGLQAIINGYLAISSGNAEIIAAGGCESMSQIPLEIRNARFTFGADTEIVFDPLGNQLKGAQPAEQYGVLRQSMIAGSIAAEYGVTQQQIEIYLDDSLKKSRLSAAKVHLLPIEVKKKKEILTITEDQKYQEIPEIAGPADGAAMCLLCSEELAEKLKLPVKAELAAVAFGAGSPGGGGWIANQIVKDILNKAGLSLEDIDFFEISECSAVQMLAQRKVLADLGMSAGTIENKVNSWGGSLITGLSWGAAGAVMVTDLIYKLHEEKKQHGMVITPAEGGQMLAVIISVN